MKAAILYFPCLEWEQVQMPVGLYKIAEYCKNKYKIVIVDSRIADAETEINRALQNYDVLCIGISVMIGSQITNANNISKKYHGKLPIVWGGGLPTIIPDLAIENEYVDYIIRGDGEEPFLNLLLYLDGKNHIKHNNFQVNILKDLKMSYIDFSNLSLPNEYFIARDGFKKAIQLETSRGCPHKCAFCHNSIFDNHYRTISEEYVRRSINDLESKFNVDGIIFQEDNMFVQIKRATNIITHLSSKSTIGWKANSRIDYFYSIVQNESLINKIVESGCHTLQFGIESGSERIIDLINKRISLSDIIYVNRVLSKYNISIRYNFIIGFPTETKDEIDQTLRFAERLRNDNSHVEPPFINIYTPLPSTKMFELAIEDGFKPPTSLNSWACLNWNEVDDSVWPRKTNDYIRRLSQEALHNSRYLK